MLLQVHTEEGQLIWDSSESSKMVWKCVDAEYWHKKMYQPEASLWQIQVSALRICVNVCETLPCSQHTVQFIFHFYTMQTQLCLISLTWEKFLALILTSFSTSCCRWKVSSCSLFSASSLLLLSSSSICRRARLSRSLRRALSLNIFLICARALQRTWALFFPLI